MPIPEITTKEKTKILVISINVQRDKYLNYWKLLRRISKYVIIVFRTQKYIF